MFNNILRNNNNCERKVGREEGRMNLPPFTVAGIVCQIRTATARAPSHLKAENITGLSSDQHSIRRDW